MFKVAQYIFFYKMIARAFESWVNSKNVSNLKRTCNFYIYSPVSNQRLYSVDTMFLPGRLSVLNIHLWKCVNMYLIFDPGWMFSPCDRLICTNKTCFSGVGTSEDNNFSECLAPNQFELMNSLKPREARFQSCARFFFGGVSREIWKTWY